MIDYIEFLKSKLSISHQRGYSINDGDINSNLFDHQKFCVRKSIEIGDYLVSAGTGLGKTIMLLETANILNRLTKGRKLILAPLAIVKQTKLEAEKFNYDIDSFADITNYQQLNNFDLTKYDGVLLDESSILKNPDGKLTKLLINSFSNFNNNFSYSATPSPNNLQSFGTQAEFLKKIKYNQFLAKFFTHDGGNTTNWILREWGKKDFYRYLSTWAVIFSHPRFLGFDNKGYDLPKLNIIEHIVKAPIKQGLLINDGKVNSTSFNAELRNTRDQRFSKVLDIVKQNPTENWFISINHNGDEKILIKELAKLGIEAYDVSGSGVTYPNLSFKSGEEEKANKLIEFSQGKYQILLTKPEIASFGLNFQKNCNNTIIAGKDFSFEKSYQWIKRVHRFGQKKDVNCHIITTDSMTNTLRIYNKKEKLFNELQNEMSKAICENIIHSDFLQSDLYGEKEMEMPKFL